jgi:zinc transport system substrate-binding protein
MSKYQLIFNALVALGAMSMVSCWSSQVTESTPEPAENGVAVTDAATDAANQDSPLTVVVSIPPQKYFVERVGGDRVEVTVLLPPGSSPATYEPRADQLQSISGADAYVRIRVPFENAIWERIHSVNPEMAVVDLTENIDRVDMATRKPGSSSAAADAPRNPDPHIWLSPPLVQEQAQTIYDALVELDPAGEATYAENLEQFQADIDQLDQTIENSLANVESRTFMVFHPAWGYFADAYGLEMLPIEVGGNEPSAAELSQLIQEAQAEEIEVVFAQPQFSTEDAETIARDIGGEVILLNPLAEDWLGNLQQVATTFERTLD